MIERLYEVFALPRPAVVDFCDHCVDPADVAPFTSVPLRELTPDHVEKFWLRSGTIGDAAFVRYLLPRVLDLIAAGELEADFFWLRLATEAHAGGDQRERAAVEAYFLATPRALAALVDEVTTAKRADHDLATWLREPDPLAVLEDAALTGSDPDGACSAAHQALESWR
ncbi:hypothetical protein BBK82_15450 [Lentzea guizhouensis]|uniref:Uncharacterized protein n=1 Tax=Lentzea guizhouensis TaxID=1586287 RepID=A0A1B2HHR5_9PSEU|nr:hypothetical protein [Lentzea guizhouensis]ANZ37250.1 hypothetical protein BBK82_15450 [Lentzea guizhouensis]